MATSRVANVPPGGHGLGIRLVFSGGTAVPAVVTAGPAETPMETNRLTEIKNPALPDPLVPGQVVLDQEARDVQDLGAQVPAGQARVVPVPTTLVPAVRGSVPAKVRLREEGRKATLDRHAGNLVRRGPTAGGLRGADLIGDMPVDPTSMDPRSGSATDGDMASAAKATTASTMGTPPVGITAAMVADRGDLQEGATSTDIPAGRDIRAADRGTGAGTTAAGSTLADIIAATIVTDGVVITAGDIMVSSSAGTSITGGAVSLTGDVGITVTLMPADRDITAVGTGTLAMGITGDTVILAVTQAGNDPEDILGGVDPMAARTTLVSTQVDIPVLITPLMVIPAKVTLDTRAGVGQGRKVVRAAITPRIAADRDSDIRVRDEGTLPLSSVPLVTGGIRPTRRSSLVLAKRLRNSTNAILTGALGAASAFLKHRNSIGVSLTGVSGRPVLSMRKHDETKLVRLLEA